MVSVSRGLNEKDEQSVKTSSFIHLLLPVDVTFSSTKYLLDLRSMKHN